MTEGKVNEENNGLSFHIIFEKENVEKEEQGYKGIRTLIYYG